MSENKLTARQKAFCQYYVELNNGTQAAIKAGYKETTAPEQASRLLKKDNVHQEIRQLQQEIRSSTIASAQEVMEYFTKVMNGEILDQFGLEAPLSERTRAAQELAKRTVDIENRMSGQADSVIEIKLDWNRN